MARVLRERFLDSGAMNLITHINLPIAAIDNAIPALNNTVGESSLRSALVRHSVQRDWLARKQQPPTGPAFPGETRRDRAARSFLQIGLFLAPQSCAKLLKDIVPGSWT